MPGSDLLPVIPAHVSVLAIYNPLLGPTDETISQQIVYYYEPQHNDSTTLEGGGKPREDAENERLRQIGLAQGMVSFARNFSKGQPFDFAETEKARVILLELEKDWWILASIQLTRLASESPDGTSVQIDSSSAPSYRYSSREICPPQLLVQHLRRANSTFLLHHDFTLDGLYHRVGRRTFCRLLENFWNKFVSNWDILLRGNPAVEIFNGLKLSAGGELGVGVGEEEWGSGEREVLEDFVARTEGLVDLVASRFGDAPSPIEKPEPKKKTKGHESTMNTNSDWLGLDAYPRPSDGIIFAGVGAISRPSLVTVSQWMEWIYRYGFEAYGVGEDPKVFRRRKHRKRRGRKTLGNADVYSNVADLFPGSSKVQGPEGSFHPGIPRPLVTGTLAPPQAAAREPSSRASSEGVQGRGERGREWSGLATDTFVKYLTLGYGSSWGLSSETQSSPSSVATSKLEGGLQNGTNETQQESLSPVGNIAEGESTTTRTESLGKFLLGLSDDTDESGNQVPDDSGSLGITNDSQTVVLRTLNIKLTRRDEEERTCQMQAIIYAHQPFIFTFLFEPNTPSLHTAALYDSIRHQFGPLQRPLLISTSPATASSRTSTAEKPSSSSWLFSTKSPPEPVYDFVYDPSNLTIRSSIPNIPDPISSPPSTPRHPASLANPPWSRAESLSVHHRLLTTYIDTRSFPHDLDRTSKTTRGWWIVWLRMSASDRPAAHLHPVPHAASPADHPPLASIQLQAQEAFIVRKASDYASASATRQRRNASGSRFLRDLGGASSSSTAAAASLSRSEIGPATLVEGLGLDARRYIESLLNLNR